MKGSGALALLLLVASVCATGYDANDVVPEVSPFDDELLQVQADPVLDAIMDVKVWCTLAAKSHLALKSDNGGKNALFDIVDLMSKAVPQDGNIVTQFGEAIGRITGKNKMSGFSGYILSRLNSNVLKGKSVFRRNGEHMVMDYSLLGFADEPEYFKKFDVTATKFLDEKGALNLGDAAKAVQKWVKEGKYSAFKRNLAALNYKYDAKIKQVEAKKTAAAKKAIHQSFVKNGGLKVTSKSAEGKKIQIVSPLSTVGSKAAQTENTEVAVPDDATLRKEAQTKANAEVMAATKKATISTVVKEVEEETAKKVKAAK